MRGLSNRRLVVAVAAMITACSGTLAGASIGASATVAGYEPVPRPAQCGAGSTPETGFQGEVPVADRLAGFTGFSCNLERAGWFQGEGTSWQVSWYGNCAYYDTANNQGSGPTAAAAQKHLGTVVLNVSDPTRPLFTKYLTTPGMLHPW